MLLSDWQQQRYQRRRPSSHMPYSHQRSGEQPPASASASSRVAPSTAGSKTASPFSLVRGLAAADDGHRLVDEWDEHDSERPPLICRTPITVATHAPTATESSPPSPSHSHSRSHSHSYRPRWRPLLSARSTSVASILLLLLVGCLLLLLVLLSVALLSPSSSVAHAVRRVLPPFADTSVDGVASHDDVSLSASFAADCVDAAHCPFHSLRHLVLVAGHAVLTSLDYHNLTDDKQWALQSFQRSQLSTFIAHIRRGVDIAAADPSALLLFSGGETRQGAGPRSEAQSYWMVAELSRWWLHGAQDATTAEDGSMRWSVRSRTSTEEFARDSYENLLFSICRFHELTQRYPDAVTIVGFSFKRDRFVQLHAPAIRYPAAHLSYAGLDPTAAHNQSALREAELANSYRPFVLDPYGCAPPLSTKRLQRNPFRRSHGYGHSSSCPELAQLLHHCGPAQYTATRLPWEELQEPYTG